MTPSLSVLITYWNDGALLRECLSSLAAQTEPPDEILVYDDGSAEPADRYIPPGSTARVIRADINLGPSHSRNALFRQSSGDYVHFHDSDDLFKPQWAERVRQEIRRAGAEIIITDGEFWNETTKIIPSLQLERLAQERDLVKYFIEEWITLAMVTFHRKSVLPLGGFRETLRWCEDWHYNIRAAALNMRFSLIHEPLVTYRMRTASYGNTPIMRARYRIEAVRLLLSDLPPKYRPYLAEVVARCSSTFFDLQLYPEAREAFRFALKIGPPAFKGRSKVYRWAVNLFGLDVAERAGALYRQVVPKKLRVLLKQ